MHSYFDTYAYNLLDNHFHFLILTTSEIELQNNLHLTNGKKIKQHQQKYLNKEKEFDSELELQFKDLLISYAQAFDKANNRVGPLFTNPFKRVLVTDEDHLTNLIIYIHSNTTKHNIKIDFEKHKWSSYQSILSSASTLLKREIVLDWFGGKENFIESHQINNNYFYKNDYTMED
jgi:putative transposase